MWVSANRRMEQARYGMAQPALAFSVGNLTQLTLSLIAIVALILRRQHWALSCTQIGGSRGSGQIGRRR